MKTHASILFLRVCLFALGLAGLGYGTKADAGTEIDYVLTAPTDPVKPGHIFEFDITVRNRTAGLETVTLNFVVPEFTTYNGQGAGSPETVFFGSVAAGASETLQLRFTVVGAPPPPEGTVITLTVTDDARAASVSRTVVVRAAPALNLQLSSGQGTVPPGGNFTYTLATANSSGGNLSGVMLSAAVPEGASFVSADGGGSQSGGVVTWNLGTLAANANSQVHVTFQASSVAGTPLGSVDAAVSDSAGHVARASDNRVVYQAPTFDYILTAVTDPVKPGHIFEYDLTVRNLTATTQSATLHFTVPEFTTYGGYAAGTDQTVFNTNVAAGTSRTTQLRFTVVGAPVTPDGTSITVNAIDPARGASVSRTVVVRAAPALNLQLSSGQGTVPPGGNFTYTLATANSSGGNLSGVMLSAAVPEGASFVSADGGGSQSGGVVTWNLGTLAANANSQVHVTFQASSVAGTPLGSVDAAIDDSAGHVARASGNRVVYQAPTFEYTLTAVSDVVTPGQVAEYDLTVHNLTATTQSATLHFTVPEFTTYGGYAAGTDQTVFNTNVAAGASKITQLLFTIDAAPPAPPGTSITVNTIDTARGASVSKTIVVAEFAPTPTPTPRHFGNISTRLSVGTGDNVLIGGFIISGTQAKEVIVRGIGPSLSLPGTLANPFLELYDSTGAIIASNDDWINSPDKQAITDSQLAPTNNKESAILMTLTPGAYTAILRGAANGNGVALVEVYDLNAAADSRLVNISTRGLVQAGDDVMIGGIIIQSDSPVKIVLRAIGPSLPLNGFLADPMLELHNSDGDIIFSNDNWRSDQEADLIATKLEPTDDLESAIVATLDPGAYTAIVRGANGTTGIALVEAYDLQ